ncbi:nuclear transport factor 2 family protein [Pseudonocardia spinosispora]|uniref:nuclear transport factor 2 family protein n=1 Tax=Pseudonocardia spinosispora TaxID=103441 RepID=UPI0004011B18|nr:nuclear transport factor 2 family protein [Pseudonocardia spinosispora]
MSDTDPGQVTRRLFELLGSQDLDQVTTLFADRVEFAVPSAPDVPWIPAANSPAGMREFFAGLPTHLEAKRFVVAKIINDAEDAVALGDLVSVVRATGRTITSRFVVHIGVHEGKINRYVMYEDSWAVAQALND